MKHTKELLKELHRRELERREGEPIPDSVFRKAQEQIERYRMTVIILSIWMVMALGGWVIALYTLYK